MAFVPGLWGVGFTLNLPGGHGLGQLDELKKRQKIKAAVPWVTQGPKRGRQGP